MELTTKIFGTIQIDDDKILEFPNGIVGFPDLKHFTLVHDAEKSSDSIHWLQSIEEPAFAMPVMDPLYVQPEYNPAVEDELLKNIGTLIPEETLVLVTVTVPKEIEKMSVNLRGPIIVNVTEKKATQVIIEGDDYPIKFPIYEILNKKKEGE